MKHIIWDWNGTLLDDAQACVETLNIILGKRKLPQVTLEKYREIFDFPVKRYYEKLGIDFQVENWDAMAREFHDIYGEKSCDRRLREGVVDVLKSLQADAVSMSVLSASEARFLEDALVKNGIRDYFQGVYGLMDIYADSKHEAGRRLIAEIGLPPRDILLVGDTTHDHEVADELKCHCLLLAGGHQAENRLRKCGCRVISDVAEVLEISRLAL